MNEQREREIKGLLLSKGRFISNDSHSLFFPKDFFMFVFTIVFFSSPI